MNKQGLPRVCINRLFNYVELCKPKRDSHTTVTRNPYLSQDAVFLPAATSLSFVQWLQLRFEEHEVYFRPEILHHVALFLQLLDPANQLQQFQLICERKKIYLDYIRTWFKHFFGKQIHFFHLFLLLLYCLEGKRDRFGFGVLNDLIVVFQQVQASQYKRNLTIHYVASRLALLPHALNLDMTNWITEVCFAGGGFDTYDKVFLRQYINDPDAVLQSLVNQDLWLPLPNHGKYWYLRYMTLENETKQPVVSQAHQLVEQHVSYSSMMFLINIQKISLNQPNVVYVQGILKQVSFDFDVPDLKSDVSDPMLRLFQTCCRETNFSGARMANLVQQAQRFQWSPVLMQGHYTMSRYFILGQHIRQQLNKLRFEKRAAKIFFKDLLATACHYFDVSSTHTLKQVNPIDHSPWLKRVEPVSISSDRSLTSGFATYPTLLKFSEPQRFHIFNSQGVMKPVNTFDWNNVRDLNDLKDSNKPAVIHALLEMYDSLQHQLPVIHSQIETLEHSLQLLTKRAEQHELMDEIMTTTSSTNVCMPNENNMEPEFITPMSALSAVPSAARFSVPSGVSLSVSSSANDRSYRSFVAKREIVQTTPILHNFVYHVLFQKQIIHHILDYYSFEY